MWTTLKPIVKQVPRFQASIYINKDEKVRCRVTIAEVILNEIGDYRKATVQVGLIDGVAKMRLVFAKEGDFDVHDLGLGGARISSIEADKTIMPDGARETEPMEVESRTNGDDDLEYILILPIAAWNKQLSGGPKPATVASVHAQIPPKVNAVAKQSSYGAKIDAVEYLRKKGVKCAKLAGDWWQVNGAREDRAQVLKRVNLYRTDSDLKQLGLEEIE